MKILGIDPGYDRVGWAVLDSSMPQQPQLLGYGCIQTSKTKTILERYAAILSELTVILEQFLPNEVAMESIFFSKNQKTAMRVSEARGVIIAGFMPICPVLVEYTPNQVKLTVTGYGSADKAAVEKMVRMQLKLQDKKIIDDTIDAIAISFTHALLRNQKL